MSWVSLCIMYPRAWVADHLVWDCQTWPYASGWDRPFRCQPHHWAEGYYVSTVGLNEATIAKYIREQERADIALDRLSVKEL